MMNAIMGGLSMLAGLGTAIGSAVEADNAAKEIRSQKAILEAQRNEQEGWFNRRYYQDILDRAEVQSMLREYNEQEETARKQANATAAITGATDDAKLATTDSTNKSKANFLAGIAQNGNMLKDQLANNWLNRLDQYYASQIGMSDKIAGIHSNTSDQLSQASSNAFNAGFRMFGNSGILDKRSTSNSNEG